MEQQPNSRSEIGAAVALRDLEPADARRLGAAGMRTFLAIADEWHLAVAARRVLLGGIGESTYHKWKSGDVGTPSRDQLERLSLLLGIYKALHILYGDKLADEWVQLPNSNAIFGGRTPLTFMMAGGLLAMQTVRKLLDARRGGA